MSKQPIFRSPARTTLECDVVDGVLRVFVGTIDIPVVAPPGQRLILETDGTEIVLSFEFP